MAVWKATRVRFALVLGFWLFWGGLIGGGLLISDATAAQETSQEDSQETTSQETAQVKQTETPQEASPQETPQDPTQETETSPQSASTPPQQTHLFSDDQPIEITASEGLEWQRDEKLWIARGDVIAKQGDSRLFSDVLIAHYAPKESVAGEGEAAKSAAGANSDGAQAGQANSQDLPQDPQSGNAITLIQAEGEVRAETPSLTAFGNEGSYNVDSKVVIFKGKDSKVVFVSGVTVGADQSIEFWELKRIGVATGNAWIKRADGSVLRGKRLVAYFAEPMGDASPQVGELEKIDAFDNVIITKGTETITGNKGVYEAANGVATVTGNVKIRRQGEEFEGEYGIMDLNMGVSKLLPLAQGEKPPALKRGRVTQKDIPKKKRRVRAVIDLSKRKSETNNTDKPDKAE